MLAGMLCSRSIASVAMFLFGVNALRDMPLRRWFSKKWWLLGLVWVALYAASWFWSTDKGAWGALFQVKLPFLFFPLAFSFIQPWTARELRIYTLLLNGFILLGAGYSISFFVRDPQAFIHGYKYSHTLPTPAYNDHIAYSTAVAATIAWNFYAVRLWVKPLHKLLLMLAVVILTLYLHLLAAKTGLLALYVFLLCYFIYYTVVRSFKKGLLIGVLIAGCIAGAYRFIPTFHERINYMYYTWQRINEGERTGLYSDMGRVISYDIALKLVRQDPAAGVGAGDMLAEMNKGYDRWYPNVSPDQRLIPHNQFLTIALAVGIPGLLFFIWWIVAPLRRIRRTREGFFFGAMWLLLLVPLFTDPFLEVQFGVFVYLFFFLMQRSLLLQDPTQKTG